MNIREQRSHLLNTWSSSLHNFWHYFYFYFSSFVYQILFLSFSHGHTFLLLLIIWESSCCIFRWKSCRFSFNIACQLVLKTSILFVVFFKLCSFFLKSFLVIFELLLWSDLITSCQFFTFSWPCKLIETLLCLSEHDLKSIGCLLKCLDSVYLIKFIHILKLASKRYKVLIISGWFIFNFIDNEIQSMGFLFDLFSTWLK